MIALAYIPIVLSFALLGAHFLRDQSLIGVAASLLLIGLLLIRKAWVARLAQAALVLGAMEWVHTIVLLAQMRAALGQPATRMIIILGTVATVTLFSALLFESARLKKTYGLS